MGCGGFSKTTGRPTSECEHVRGHMRVRMCVSLSLSVCVSCLGAKGMGWGAERLSLPLASSPLFVDQGCLVVPTFRGDRRLPNDMVAICLVLA